jgi:hypothetical protein
MTLGSTSTSFSANAATSRPSVRQVASSGQVALRILFYAPYRNPQIIVERHFTFRWK